MKLPRILSAFLTHITMNRSRVPKRAPEYVRASREDLQASRSRPTYSVFIMFASRKLFNDSFEFLFYPETSYSRVWYINQTVSRCITGIRRGSEEDPSSVLRRNESRPLSRGDTTCKLFFHRASGSLESLLERIGTIRSDVRGFSY